jgi:hypothetical protein
MTGRFIAMPRREFTRIAVALNRLATQGVDRQTLRWRKAWIAWRMLRQLVIHRQYIVARSFTRVVMAHPDFRSDWRVWRYCARTRIGLIEDSLRALRRANGGSRA